MEAKKAEMERLGLSQDMLDMAQDVGMSLEKSIEGTEAVRRSLETLQKLAKLLDTDAANLYNKAKQALDDSNEELARKLLLERTTVQEKLKKVLIDCTEEKKRLQIMEENIARLEKRAIEIESLLRRTVSEDSEADEEWDLKKILSIDAIKHACPIKCSHDTCTLVAATVWISNKKPTENWYSCLDCQVI